MGTTSVRRAPRSPEWKRVVTDLGKDVRKAAPLVDSGIKTVLPMLPDGPTKAPIYWGASEGVRFCVDVHDHGLEKAVKNEGVRLTQQFVAPQISDAVWNKIAEKSPGLANSPTGRIAEYAFRDTMNDIITRGAEAGLDRL